LAQIALEERSHAEFSWALLAWLVARGGERVSGAVARRTAALDLVKRPTAVSADKARVVAAADPSMMRAHSRIPGAGWATLWHARLDSTRRRANELLAQRSAPDRRPRVAADEHRACAVADRPTAVPTH